MSPRCVALAACLGLALALVASVACAQRVVVLSPPGEDAVLLAAFAHLRGELTVQEFEIVVRAATSEPTSGALERAAAEAQAEASILLGRASGQPVAEVWTVDRRTGHTLRSTITTVPRPEGARLLAVRTVDLVRARLRDLTPPAAPEAAVAPARSEHPERSAPRAPATPADARRRHFALEVAGLLQAQPSGFSPAYGPSLALGYDPNPWLGLRVLGQAPLRRARSERGGASATLSMEQLVAELRVRLVQHHAWSLSALADAGALHVSVEGTARAPHGAARDAAWTALLGLGLGGAFRFMTRAALTLRARCLLLAPRPLVRVADHDVPLGRPSLQLAGGIDVAL